MSPPVRKLLLTQLKEKDVDLAACLISASGTCFEAVFQKANENKTLPSYWRNLIINVRLCASGTCLVINVTTCLGLAVIVKQSKMSQLVRNSKFFFKVGKA